MLRLTALCCIAAGLAFAALGCTSTPAPPADADVDVDVDGDADADADADGDGDTPVDGDAVVDAVAPAEPGPLTLVAEHIAVVPDRLCDLDGDGTMDNAIADLGESSAMVTAAAINATVEGQVEEGWRLLYHFPWLDDRAAPSDPEAVLVAYGGLPLDDDLEDDFSGSEPFVADAFYLDACGEPRCSFESAGAMGGVVSASGGSTPLMFGGILGRGTVLFGTIGPAGASAQLEACAVALISELGAARAPTTVGDSSLLEMIVAGGAAYGLPLLPGVTPDMDLDGDGLERVIVDDESRLQTCIDGDMTTIEGRDCWADPRMADGFSIVLRMRFVGAEHAGLEEDWQDWVAGECTEPPETSLWAPR